MTTCTSPGGQDRISWYDIVMHGKQIFGYPSGERPKVVDRKGVRQLYFDKRHIQSAMRLDDPYALELVYTRMMMAFLLFAPSPAEVLIIGLGGGSLAKFCHRYLPGTRITVVEVNAEVIALRQHFAVPDDERMGIVHADALEYLPGNDEKYAAILLDAFDAEGIAPSFADPGFYPAAAARLRPNGVFVANLVGDRVRWQGQLKMMWSAFSRRVRIAPVPSEEEHYIAMAFHDPRLYRIPPDIDHTAGELMVRVPLDFEHLAQWVRKGDVAEAEDK